MGGELAVILIVAFLAMTMFSLAQHRRYIRVINEMAKEFAGPGRYLVSGRAKGRLRGTVVALVVDVPADEVVEARVMSGASVFAQLRPEPSLRGSLSDVVERARPGLLRKAVEASLTQLPADVQPPVATPRQLNPTENSAEN